MTIELIISLIALTLAVFAAVRTFFNCDKVIIKPETEVKAYVKKEGTSEDNSRVNPRGGDGDVFKKTLQSIEDYRK